MCLNGRPRLLTVDSALALGRSFQRNDGIRRGIVVGPESFGCGSCKSCMVRVRHAYISDIARSNVSVVRLTTTSYIPPV